MLETKTPKKSEDIQNGWIDIDEFLPAGDTFVVQMLPAKSDKESESGLILKIQDSSIHDRPNGGFIVRTGPECTRRIGEFVYTQRTSGIDLGMIRKPADAEYSYVLLYDDAIIGNFIPRKHQ